MIIIASSRINSRSVTSHRLCFACRFAKIDDISHIAFKYAHREVHFPNEISDTQKYRARINYVVTFRCPRAIPETHRARTPLA